MSKYDDLLDKARKAAEVFRASAGEFVPKMYEALRHEGVDPWDAKDRIEKDLAGIWQKDTIRRHIPETAKNPGLSAAARKSNSQRKKAGKNPAPEAKPMIVIGNDGSQQLDDKPEEPELQKARKDFQQYELETNDYIHALKDKLKALEEPHEGDMMLEVGNQIVPVHYIARQIPKFHLTLFVDPHKVKEMYR